MDFRDVDAIRMVIHESRFGGSWDDEIKWTEEHGGEERKEDLWMARSLKEFEERYGVEVAELPLSPQDRKENRELYEIYKSGGIEALRALVEEREGPPRAPAGRWQQASKHKKARRKKRKRKKKRK